MATDSSSAVIRYPASAVAFTAEFRAVTRAESVTRAGTVSETVSGLVAVTGSGQGSVNAYSRPARCNQPVSARPTPNVTRSWPVKSRRVATDS